MTRRAAAPAPELVTDWIPCTTPPVRDGVYEASFPTNPADNFMAEYKTGQWFGTGKRAGKFLNAMDHYQWRGVRRWVLQGPEANMLSILANETVYIYLEDARPRSAKWNSLAKARPFRTQDAAQRFAARYSRLGLTAVLP